MLKSRNSASNIFLACKNPSLPCAFRVFRFSVETRSASLDALHARTTYIGYPTLFVNIIQTRLGFGQVRFHLSDAACSISIRVMLLQVSCKSCRENFCFRHRHEDDHSCQVAAAALLAQRQRPQQQRQRQQKPRGPGGPGEQQPDSDRKPAAGVAAAAASGTGSGAGGTECGTEAGKAAGRREREASRHRAATGVAAR